MTTGWRSLPFELKCMIIQHTVPITLSQLQGDHDHLRADETRQHEDYAKAQHRRQRIASGMINVIRAILNFRHELLKAIKTHLKTARDGEFKEMGGGALAGLYRFATEGSWWRRRSE